MMVKIYTCPKCKEVFSYPSFNGMKEARFDFYQIGVICPNCEHTDYFSSFIPKYVHIDDDKMDTNNKNG